MKLNADEQPCASSISTDATLASDLTRLARENATQLRGGPRPDLLDQAEKIAQRMRTQDRRIPAFSAWCFGTTHHARGDFGRAIDYFAMADCDSETVNGSDRALVAAGHAAALWAQGDLVTGRALADEALLLAVEAGDDLVIAVAKVSQALLLSAGGTRPENRQAYETGLVHAERANDVITVVRCRGNLVSTHGEEDRSQQALAELDRAIALADSSDVGPIGVVPYLSRAEVFRALGRLDEALAEGGVAVEAYRVGALQNPFTISVSLANASIFVATCHDETR